jgi:hypothetical protein
MEKQDVPDAGQRYANQECRLIMDGNSGFPESPDGMHHHYF